MCSGIHKAREKTIPDEEEHHLLAHFSMFKREKKCQDDLSWEKPNENYLSLSSPAIMCRMFLSNSSVNRYMQNI